MSHSKSPLFAGLLVLLLTGPVAAQSVGRRCETVDFNQFQQAQPIQNLSLFGGEVSLSLSAIRNEPNAVVDVTAYDTEMFDRDAGTPLPPPPNRSHDDTQRFILCNAATNGGIGECDGIVAMIPDVDFFQKADDTQGGEIRITGFSGAFEIPSFAAVDADDATMNILLEVGAARTLVGQSSEQGNGTVETVQTSPHMFTGEATFVFMGSNAIDEIEICQFLQIGMVGDTVFEDVDGDGLQCRDGVEGPLDGACQSTEPLDPGIPDVKLNLESVCADEGDEIVDMQRTDATGFYKFRELPLDCKYTVTVDPCNFDSGVVCGDGEPGGALEGLVETPPQQGDDICRDSGGLDDQGSAVGDMAMTFLPVMNPVSEQEETNDPCLDFGYRRPVCEIAVDKTCCIPAPPRSEGFDCEDAKPITSLTMIWDGPPGVDVDAPGGETFSNLQPGDPITFSSAGFGNDVEIKLSGAVSGVSTFHVSCSDDDMDGPEDCPKPQGNGKKDDSKFVNLWKLGGMAGDQSFSCTPPDPNGTQCVVSGGSTGNDCQGDVLEAIFEYTGAACQNPLPNGQSGKAKCSGNPGGATATIVADESDIDLNGDGSSTSGIAVGDTVRVRKIKDGEQKDLPSNLELEVIGAGTQTLEIHTSCSKPLNVGDEFGSLKLIQLTTDELGTVVLDTDPELFQQMCELLAPPPPHCTSKPVSLTLRYVGGDCSASDNSQKEDECSGGDPGPPTSAEVDSDDVTASVDGDRVILTVTGKKFDSNTDLSVTGSNGTQRLEFHTSCSQPLNLGDQFGAFELIALDPKDGPLVAIGGEVEYQYRIQNPNPGPVSITSVFDDQLGELLAPMTLDLGPGGEQTLIESTFVEESVTNTVTVSGEIASGGQCLATDSVEVEVVSP